jgi:hypothetical protein
MEINWRVHVAYDESGPLLLIRSPRSVLLAKPSEPITIFHAVKLLAIQYLTIFKATRS